MDGWRRDDVPRRDRPAVGDAVAEHADARHRDRLSGHRAVRRARSSSEGRGTTRPFELVGAPWIDGERLADAMNARGLAGRAFPSRGLRADVPEAREASRAAAARFTSPIASAFRPVQAGVALIDEFRGRTRSRFAWREPPYEYEHDKLPIDILAGSDALRRTQIEARASPRAVDSRGVRMQWQFRRAAAESVHCCTRETCDDCIDL